MRIQAVLLLCLAITCAFLPVLEAEQLGDKDITMNTGGKQTWPELVGKPYAEAEAVIKRDAPELKVSKVKPGSMMTMDYREDRVRVFVDNDDKVEKAPSLG